MTSKQIYQYITAGAMMLATGCATAPPQTPPALTPALTPRVVIAQPLKMRSSLFLNFADGDFPATRAYQAFCNRLGSGLAAKGFTVVDVCSRANTSVIAGVIQVPPVSRNEADVILVPIVDIGYFASTRLHDFKVQALGYFILIDVKSRKVIGEPYARVQAPIAGMPQYSTQQELASDLDRVMQVLTRAGGDLGDLMLRELP